MKREFKKGEIVFVWNHWEADLNGFGQVLKDEVAENGDEIVLVQVNNSGEVEEVADKIFKLMPRRICAKCGCAILVEHEEDAKYPYYCPCCDENMYTVETTQVSYAEYDECLKDSIGRFLPEDEN